MDVTTVMEAVAQAKAAYDERVAYAEKLVTDAQTKRDECLTFAQTEFQKALVAATQTTT